MDQTAVREQHPQAKEAFQRWDDLKQHRAQHEGDWEDIARLIRPQRGGFSSSMHDARRHEKPLSSEPIQAAASFSAGIYAAITNPANRWCGFETPDVELNNWKPMNDWLDVVTRRVLNSFSPAMSSFYPATYQAYSDIAAFGNASGYDEIDLTNKKFIDVTLSLAEVVVDIDAHGRVVEWVRKYRLSPMAAAREFARAGDALPDKVIDLAQKGDTGKITFVQHIRPNDKFAPGGLGARGKRYLSLTACEIGQTLVRIKGYDEMPSYYPRWDVDRVDSQTKCKFCTNTESCMEYEEWETTTVT